MGKVKLSSDRGLLRLRWTVSGKRYSLNTGFRDNPSSRLYGQKLCNSIELDILGGNFDPTLAKYRPAPSAASEPQQRAVTPKDIFDKWIEMKLNTSDPAKPTRVRYGVILKHLEHFKGKNANAVLIKDVSAFKNELLKTLSQGTVKDYLQHVSAAFDWAIDEGLVKVPKNVWLPVMKGIKVPQQQKVKPFTRDEVQAILEGFERLKPTYAPYVRFLFSTGCRLGEASALKWKHVSDDYSEIWIGESNSRGIARKSTKTGKARTLLLGPKIQEMLRDLKPKDAAGQDFIFVNVKGRVIDSSNFRYRSWKPVLESLGIEYRKPYATRHTAISHALANGADPLSVAEQMGHDPKVLFQAYASAIGRKSVLTEF